MIYLTPMLLMSPPADGNSASGMMNLIFIGAIFIVMYFFMIRPQTKKAKEQKKFLESLQKGDSVITIGGIHGKVNKVNESNLLVEVDTNTILKIEKSGISTELSKSLNQNKNVAAK